MDDIHAGLLAEDGVTLGVAFEADGGRGVSCVPVFISLEVHVLENPTVTERKRVLTR